MTVPGTSKSKFKNVFNLTNFLLTIKKMTPHRLSSQILFIIHTFQQNGTEWQRLP